MERWHVLTRNDTLQKLCTTYVLPRSVKALLLFHFDDKLVTDYLTIKPLYQEELTRCCGY